MLRENQNEIWQVEVGGQVYEAPLSELFEWIDEGSLHPADKIRKGNLRWIEARKVPSLIPFFNAREKGEPMPVILTTTEAEVAIEDSGRMPPAASILFGNDPGDAASQVPVVEAKAGQSLRSETHVTGYCRKHSDRETVYVCSGCSIEFCKTCPSSYGGGVRICPDCGSLCRSVKDAAAAVRSAASAAAFDGEPFGAGDLSRAIAHPFKFKPSFIFGGLMFMFFTLGQSASAFGGIVLIVASIFCALLANMLTFGILSNTVDNFSKGNLDSDFMPAFDDFNLWGDVVHPFLLSIGVYLSSFGPFLLVAIIGVYLIMGAAGEQMKKFNDELSTVPGTQYYQPDRTAAQTQEVKDLLQRVKQQNDKRLADQQNATAANPTSTETADLEKTLQEAHTQPVETPAERSNSYRDAITRILHLAAPLVVLGMITFLWGACYFPAACAVAGYTRSFTAVMNPLVGLDTIRRLGGTYVKILLMGLLILIVSSVTAFAINLVLSPLDLPRVGNVPARAVGSVVTFYFWIVFSCILGYALFKSADKLKLYR